MRDILFKGIRKDGMGWALGDLSQLEDVTLILSRETWGLQFSGDLVHFDYVEVDPDTICQFTGLTDKSDVKIFSDDLRKDEQGRIFRIYSVPGGFAIKDSYWASNISDLILTDILIMHGLTDAQTQSWIRNSTEAAGNIHENKEGQKDAL